MTYKVFNSKYHYKSHHPSTYFSIRRVWTQRKMICLTQFMQVVIICTWYAQRWSYWVDISKNTPLQNFILCQPKERNITIKKSPNKYCIYQKLRGCFHRQRSFFSRCLSYEFRAIYLGMLHHRTLYIKPFQKKLKPHHFRISYQWHIDISLSLTCKHMHSDRSANAVR